MKSVPIVQFPRLAQSADIIALEAPLTIDIVHGPPHHRKWFRFVTTMRSPGHDEELVLGLLYSLSIIDCARDVIALSPCIRSRCEGSNTDSITAELAFERRFLPLDFLSGHARFSGCGICGGEALPQMSRINYDGDSAVDAAMLLSLPAKVSLAQTIFHATGGVHAATLFDEEGSLKLIFEDVGRHNALDKLVGSLVRQGTPEMRGILVVSSRASFEIIQKAARAGLSTVAVMGAVSSLAVSEAQHCGVTLVGFLRTDRFNVYTHPERIRGY